MVQMPRSLRKKLFVRAGLDPAQVDAEAEQQEQVRKDAEAAERAARKPIPR